MRIRTGGRLHFGLIAPVPVPGWDRLFGGIGLMIEQPGYELEVSLAEAVTVSGEQSEALLPLVQQFAKRFNVHLDVRVRQVIPEHVGLGSGTQRALAVAFGLEELTGFDKSKRETHSYASLLTDMTGRGRRSAIGTFGFLLSGFLWDAGKPIASQDSLGHLVDRLHFPEDWPILLSWPRNAQGSYGEMEKRFFAELPPPDIAIVRRLHHLAFKEIHAALEQKDFAAFAPSLYEFNRLAGECFLSAQGGAYGSREITERVECLRKLGAIAVGQSSWGPVVFAILPNQNEAGRIMRFAQEMIPNCHWMLTKAKNSACLTPNSVISGP